MAQDQVNADIQTPEVDSLEFKLLLAYTHKRRPTDTRLQQNIQQKERSKPKVFRKNKKFSFLKCIKPQTDDNDVCPAPQPATLQDVKVDEMEKVASVLTEISDSLDIPSDIAADGDDENVDVVKQLADMLRTHGDDLDEKIKADIRLREILQSSFKYSFFQKVLETFCKSVSSDVPPPQQEDEKMNVALICEATSLLSSISLHPMNQVLGFGAHYLQEKYPTWVSRNMQLSNGEVADESKEEVH
ncbi:apoptosis facilitator Bcl-2-like protein 14 [Danio rerio]|uniref:Apoptosis facilitator Bcl-2-like protein 14 n=1 Tax=Danio rerio TaxID=7955 RepID=E7EYP8_DANRE|nr:apoptosis facilitator Bcl-2-like protein 14 [Danio rerio]|eukprot:NP_001314930.1 uncharacterized protein LOC101885512 [Danio rerio]